ncbi:mediator of RNA polymerase II transcription subunit 1 domain-containing protein [Trichoderma novae-zelandiae]
MATPTPMRHAPSQQGRTPSHQGPTPSQIAGATPPISTPFSNPAQAAFSPRGQRSSPQQVKKSPATSTLMGQSGIGALNFDSPSTAAAMGALGMGGSFDMGLDHVGVGGLDALGVFATEDDKLKRLDSILRLLNQKKGFVSEAGLERLAQRLGLELLSEEHAAANGRKKKTLAIAGSAIAVDIVLDNNIVQNVSLTYHGSATSVAADMEAASHILLADLKLGPNQSPLTKTLDKFASNFGYIANLDKLSVIPGLDCYEALAGIFTSLERLHQWDLSNLRNEPEMAGKSDQYLSLAALCTRHGYPAMHARNRVGLALQYWKELRFVPPSDDRLASFSENEEKVWSLLIGCAPIETLGVSPVRVSEDWISKDVVKQDLHQQDQALNPTNIPILDWQEPENISLPSSDENKNSGMEVLQLHLSTLPQVAFTVTFDPPVILPQNDCMRLYSYVNSTPPNPNPANDFSQRPLPPPTFDDLFFPVSAGSRQDPSEPRTVTRLRDVLVFDQQGQSFTRSHHNTLFVYKPIYSQEVTDMSFSHPRQLIDMLPLLRQYAFLSTLLNNSFGPETKEALPKSARETSAPAATTQTVKDELAAFMESSDDEDQNNGVSKEAGQKVEGEAEQGLNGNAKRGKKSDKDMDIDVIIWVHPLPYLQVVFPVKNSTIDITLRILEGGVVEIANENVVEHQVANGKSKVLNRQDLGKALERLEDLCKWAEWIRTRLC